MTDSLRTNPLRFVSGHDLADENPYADEDRAERGMEPFQGHHFYNLRYSKLLSFSVVPART